MREDPRFDARVFSRAQRGERPRVLIGEPGQSSRRLIPLARELSASFDVFAPVLRGRTGAVAGGPQSIQSHARWLASWIRLIGLPRTVVLARAAACPIAVELALANLDLVDRLILLSPAETRSGLWSFLPRRTSGLDRRLAERLAQLPIPLLLIGTEPASVVGTIHEFVLESRLSGQTGSWFRPAADSRPAPHRGRRLNKDHCRVPTGLAKREHCAAAPRSWDHG